MCLAKILLIWIKGKAVYILIITCLVQSQFIKNGYKSELFNWLGNIHYFVVDRDLILIAFVSTDMETIGDISHNQTI